MTRSLRALLPFVVVSALLGAGSASAASTGGPIAVMPFKNLNTDPQLDWLRVGIAETMIADLRREDHVVVERDQLDQALTEIALQEAAGSETSTAAKVGRMLGAHTVVVGGFQRAGGRVRITARFVTVETGVVRETAKATGSLEDIFELQDQIVERLIGRKPKRRPPQRRSPKRADAKERPKQADAPRTVTKKDTVDAYRLYAMSLQTSSQAERVRYLKQAIELDPGFRYALDDLAALEQRMDRYNEKNREVRAAVTSRTREELDDDRLSPEERSQRAFQLLSGHMQALRYRALLEDAERVYRMDLPIWATLDVREFASFSIFQAHMMLKQTDLALQAGERHLKEFPGGTYYLGVESSMQSLIDQRRRDEKSRSTLPAELAEIEEERAEVLADAQRRGRASHLGVRLRGLDFRRCSAAQSHRDFDAVMQECPRFLEAYAGDPEAKDLLAIARWSVILARVERGEFAAARALAERFLAEDPAHAEQYSVKVQMRFWPRE